MNESGYLFTKACLLGDGSLTRITRQGRNTVMISFTHSLKQKPWLEYKASRLNEIFGRSCSIGDREVKDLRTGSTNFSCQFSLTSKDLIPLYELAYPKGVKTFSESLLEGLGAEHLAILWADDGNLSTPKRIGRLNLYEPIEQCEIVNRWVESICGAVGRYEDYEGNGTGRLRYPASEMVKIAIAIKPYLHPMMFYKVDMQYQRNVPIRNLLAASSPNQDLPRIDELPQVDEMTSAQWSALAKKVGVPAYKRGTKTQIRERVISLLEVLNGR